MYKYHIFGFGEPIVDVIGRVSYDFLKENEIEKGSRRTITPEYRDFLINNPGMEDKQLSPGGTTCNTVISSCCLGGSNALLGIMADDKEGNFFLNSCQKVGLDIICKPQQVELPTSSCVILVSPDAERTMNTYIGASTFSAQDYITAENISKAKLFYTEIYKLFSKTGLEEVQAGLKVARDNNVKTAITLGDYTCVNALYDVLLPMIKDIDIVLGNEFEIPSLLKVNLEDMESIKTKGQEFAKLNNSVVVMTMASRGVILFDPKLSDPVHIEAIKVNNLVDATGAGDSFASGFVSGYVNDLSTIECGHLGTYVASRVISKIGAVLSKEEDADFINQINKDFNLKWEL